MPERIQLKRKKGWRLPDGAVNVARPTKWGNPFRWSDYPAIGYNDDGEPFSIHDDDRRRFAVVDFEAVIRYGVGSRLGYPPLEEIQAELRGKDLACWCPNDPCHASVLLELSNG